jgi:hypothetical protein
MQEESTSTSGKQLSLRGEQNKVNKGGSRTRSSAQAETANAESLLHNMNHLQQKERDVIYSLIRHRLL